MPDLLTVRHLSKAFVTRRRWGRPQQAVQAVDDVSVSLAAGETLALVGESGAGKTTLGRLTLRLVESDEGSIDFEGADIRSLSAKELRRWRRNAQMIFQDPFTSLDPRKVVGDAIAESLVVHRIGDARERADRVEALLARVGIRADQVDLYPHEFSGGQLQRIAIARALAPEPRFIVCDEPVAALDMSIRAQVLNLLRDLQEERGLAYLFVTHDLSLTRVIAHRVAVMYRGRILEIGDAQEIFEEPRHPYTRELLAAIPVPDPERPRKRKHISVTDTTGDIRGCRYADRCDLALPECRELEPSLRRQGQVDVACHLYANAVDVHLPA